MKIKAIIDKLIEFKLYKLTYMLLSVISIFLGKFSKFKLIDNDLWLQKQNETFFCDYTPNYRLVASDLESSCEDIFFYSYVPNKGDICVDIGAGIGTDTRLMSQLVGKEGKIFSIEATKKTFKALDMCVKYNQLENVTTSQYAIANTNGPIKVSEEAGHHTENKITFDDTESFSIVNGITIDDYIALHNISMIDYMKVNIEGAEKFMIEVFNKIEIVRHIAISSHDFLGLRTGDKSYFTKDIVIDFLKDNNFESYTRTTGIDYKDGWIYGVNRTFSGKII